MREQIHIEAALEQQKLEDQKALERAMASALEHRREDLRLEQEKKVCDSDYEFMPVLELLNITIYSNFHLLLLILFVKNTYI